MPRVRPALYSVVATDFTMSTVAIDTRKLLRALKSTGKDSNFSADEIANAVDAAQESSELLTKSDFAAGMSAFDARMARFEARMDGFEARMEGFEARMEGFEARMDGFAERMDAFDVKLEARLEALRADIKAEVKAGQVQNLLWLSGIVLVSNGAVIALLARATRLF
jgi:hypothetical protein